MFMTSDMQLSRSEGNSTFSLMIFPAMQIFSEEEPEEEKMGLHL